MNLHMFICIDMCRRQTRRRASLFAHQDMESKPNASRIHAPVRMDYSGPFMIEARKPPPDPVTLQLVVSAEDTVATLKGRLASQREDWSSEQMNVILQGKFLQDPQTMAECELKNGDFVVITGMVARDFRRPAQEEAELRREGEGEEGTPFFAPPAVVNLPTDNQSIERT